MPPWARIALLGALTVVVFDALASLASRATGIAYGSASVGSWLLYAGFGYLAARAVPGAPVRAAVLTGLMLGVTDATLGWATSWALGPGRVPGGLSARQWLATFVIVAATAAGIAALGGVFARGGRGPDASAKAPVT